MHIFHLELHQLTIYHAPTASHVQNFPSIFPALWILMTRLSHSRCNCHTGVVLAYFTLVLQHTHSLTRELERCSLPLENNSRKWRDAFIHAHGVVATMLCVVRIEGFVRAVKILAFANPQEGVNISTSLYSLDRVNFSCRLLPHCLRCPVFNRVKCVQSVVGWKRTTCSEFKCSQGLLRRKGDVNHEGCSSLKLSKLHIVKGKIAFLTRRIMHSSKIALTVEMHARIKN